ncbi:MAG TPA: hypothetical protein GX710_09015, partial [Clostridiales bacterium]|nr:hypothetical protein [Clostridiales bacterium]
MSKRKATVIIIIVIVIISAVIIFCWRPVSRIFKKSSNMNYKNMDYIEVYPSSGGYIKIEDSEDIEKILDNFNSLKVIKEKIPSKSKLEYHGEGKYEEYLERLRETGAFSISFHGSSSDRIYFTNEYFTIYHNGYDWDYTEYYIKDSGYNPEDKTSKFSDFLDELISKYVEE